jgi:L-ascorbate metabolism protein UlaG (beta-lactamase superfamily)
MRRALWIFASIVLLVLAAAAGWTFLALRDRPSLEPYASLRLPAAEPAAGAMRVTFLGVSTLLFDDGETALLTDGFFSRPGLLRTLLGKIEPDRGRIEAALERAGIRSLAAVFAVHSHYDHAMDSPEVARRTGALLVGSESTANIGRGWGLAEERIRVVRPGEPMTFGAFRVTLLVSRHFPHGMAMGEIRAPLVPPARAFDYLAGESYSILIEHGGRRLLVQGSAGYVEGALQGPRAKVVLLGVGALSTQDDEYRRAYWREVVTAVGARRVIPIHWDDFTLPLDEPLRPMPRRLDDLDVTMRFLLAGVSESGIDVRLLPEWTAVDPFAGL